MDSQPQSIDQNQPTNRLHGGNVLVKSTHDTHNPPVVLRGTIDARSPPGTVKVVLEYPDMTIQPARQGVITLDRATVARLVASEHDGVYEIAINHPLDPGPELQSPQVAS